MVRMETTKINRRQLWIAASIYVGQITFGYALGWSSAVLPKFEDKEQSPLSRPISETEASLIGSLLYVGAITGPIFTAFLANAWGRKPCLFVSGAFSMGAYVVLALTTNLSMVFAGRILVGIGIGTLSILSFVYIGEIAYVKFANPLWGRVANYALFSLSRGGLCPAMVHFKNRLLLYFTLYQISYFVSKNIRGILLSGAGVSASIGTLISYSTGPYLTYAATTYIGLVLCLCYILGLFIIPESPTFYVIKDDKKKVKEILESLGRANDIVEVLGTKVSVEKREWKQIFTVKTNRRALIITSCLHILQQTSGVVAIIFYTTNIFEIANSSIQPHIATIIIGLTQIIGSFITPFVVERSRRIVLLISTAICSICMAIFGTYFYLDAMGYEFIEKIQWIPLAALIIYFLGYDMGFGVIPSTLAGEMFRSNVRTTGSTAAITSGLVFGFGVTTAFGYAITYLGGYVVFWAFSATCAIAFLFTLFCVPETRGKSLMEIQLMLDGKSKT